MWAASASRASVALVGRAGGVARDREPRGGEERARADGSQLAHRQQPLDGGRGGRVPAGRGVDLRGHAGVARRRDADVGEAADQRGGAAEVCPAVATTRQRAGAVASPSASVTGSPER